MWYYVGGDSHKPTSESLVARHVPWSVQNFIVCALLCIVSLGFSKAVLAERAPKIVGRRCTVICGILTRTNQCNLARDGLLRELMAGYLGRRYFISYVFFNSRRLSATILHIIIIVDIKNTNVALTWCRLLGMPNEYSVR